MRWDRANSGPVVKVFLIILLFCGVTLFTACSRQVLEPASQQVPLGDAQRGRYALQDYGCGVCHVIPGVPTAEGLIGMPLSEWGDRSFIAGRLSNEPEDLIAWIQAPESIKPGTAMPNLGVTEQDARDMSQYLYTLRKADTITALLTSIRVRISWLLDRPDPARPPVQVATLRGWEVYARHCAECHRFEGEGLRGSIPPLRQNPTVTADDPAMAIQVILHGRGGMPGFAGRLTDEHIVAVATYIRNAWGNNATPVDSDQVSSLR